VRNCTVSPFFASNLTVAMCTGSSSSSMCRDGGKCAVFLICMVWLLALPYVAAIKLLVKSQQVECVSHTMDPEQVQV
jgi:hypothetical protein